MWNKKWKKAPFIAALLFTLALLPATLWLGGPGAAASPEDEPDGWEETVFLGEAVPLRLEGRSLEDLLRARFQEPGEMECWWVSPEGPVELKKLGEQRPREDQEYALSAVLHPEDGGKDQWLNAFYQVRVVSGSIRVWAEGESVRADSWALVKLEGQGLTVYRQALPEADPQGGGPALETEFTGLPYGVYTVSVADGGLEPEQVVCRLGVCQEDDTVSTDRRTALARFTVEETASAVRESYQLRGGA